MDAVDAVDSLARELGARLHAARWLLATAESCTGGWVSEAVTAVAGSSAWFDRGFVTYSNDAKQEMLGVPAATLTTYGAVSEATAAAMADGAIAHSRAQVSVAITGVAGPGGGTPSKPVGMVCLGWATRRSGGKVTVLTRTHQFAGDRTAIRRQAVEAALAGLLERIDE